MDADGSGERRLTNSPAEASSPAWSPDGRKIAFTGAAGIYVINADGSDQRKLARGLLPIWSPDGRKIAFLRGGVGVHVMNADGTGQRRLGASLSDGASWSPDGRQVLFSRFVGHVSEGNFEVFVANVDGSGSRNLTRNPGADVSAVWSATRRP